MLEDIFDVMDRWLYIEDREQVEVIMAVALASQFPGDPVWMFAVGPSGSAKTEILRSLSTSERIYTVDTVTPRSFISGFAGKASGTVDLLPKLDGKLLVIKDFSQLLETGTQKQKETVFSVLRSAYDGYYEAVYGSGVGKKSYYSTFGIIAGVTEVIDYFSKVHAMLGERFIKVRTRYDRLKSLRAAFKHSGREKQMREEIANVVRISLDFYSNLSAEPRLTDATANKLLYLADCVSILRTPVPRDYKHEVSYLLSSEVATRLGKQFLRLAQCLHRMGCWNYNHLVRVAQDSVFPERLKIVQFLKGGEATLSEIAQGTRLPRHLVKISAEDLYLLKACDRRLNNDTYYYSLDSSFYDSMSEAKL